MKGIFIAFDQAHYNTIIEQLHKLGARGFTAWEQVQGRGSKTGEPHYGTHAWPSMASAIMAMVEDDRVDAIMAMLHELDQARPKLGLRAWTWNIEQSI